jgi:hypothetical protein
MRILGWSIRGMVMWGVFLVLLGTVTLLANYGVWNFPFKLSRDWPMILIGWGLLKIIDAIVNSGGIRLFSCNHKTTVVKDYRKIINDLENGKITAEEAVNKMEQ